MPQLLQTWDNSHFFKGTDDPKIATTVAEVKTKIAAIAATCAPFTQKIETAETLEPQEFATVLASLQTIHKTRTALAKQLGNVRTYISTALSVDAKDANASTLRSTLQQIGAERSEEHTSELQSPCNLVCRLLLEKKNNKMMKLQ